LPGLHVYQRDGFSFRNLTDGHVHLQCRHRKAGRIGSVSSILVFALLASRDILRYYRLLLATDDPKKVQGKQLANSLPFISLFLITIRKLLRYRQEDLGKMMVNQIAPELQTTQWFNSDVPLTLQALRERVVVIEVFQMLWPPFFGELLL
jgi:hypothetical protein